MPVNKLEVSCFFRLKEVFFCFEEVDGMCPLQDHQEDDILVSEVSTTSETSGNLRKPWKRHDLETYVSFPGNLLPKSCDSDPYILATT
jgi:hypothetical protein